MISCNVDGTLHRVEVPPDMRLRWVRRDALGLTGTTFGGRHYVPLRQLSLDSRRNQASGRARQGSD